MRGRYFFPLSTRFVDAAAERRDETLLIHGDDGTALTSIGLKDVRATARLGAMPRRLDFPDGGSFETPDNDAVDEMLRHSSLLHRLESSWRAVLIAVMASALAAVVFAVYGVPATAGWLARRTPASFAAYTTRQTLTAMDKIALHPSTASLAIRQHYQDMFAEVAAHAPRGTNGYRLIFRNAPGIGPNAFALPDGTVVVTDQIVPFVKRDEEIEGVFAHEMSHVDHAHGLQRIYEASLVPAAVAFITGDVSQVAHFATILPGILLQAAYSRAFEQQADDDAASLLRRMGKDPAPLADLLERMEKKMCGPAGSCIPSWLGSHPATTLRAARLRGG